MKSTRHLPVSFPFFLLSFLAIPITAMASCTLLYESTPSAALEQVSEMAALENYVRSVEGYSRLLWPGALKSDQGLAAAPTLRNGRITFDRELYPVSKPNSNEGNSSAVAGVTRSARELSRILGANFKDWEGHDAIEFLPPDSAIENAHYLSRLAGFLSKQKQPIKVVYDPSKALGEDSDAFTEFDAVARILYVSHGALAQSKTPNPLLLHELVHVFEKLNLENGVDSLFHGWVEPPETGFADRSGRVKGYGYAHLSEIRALSHTVTRLCEQFGAMLENGNPTLKEMKQAMQVLRGFTTLSSNTFSELDIALSAKISRVAQHTSGISLVQENTHPEQVALIRKRGMAFPIPGFHVVFIPGSRGEKDVYLQIKDDGSGAMDSGQIKNKAIQKLKALRGLTRELSTDMFDLSEEMTSYNRGLNLGDKPYFLKKVAEILKKIRQAERDFGGLDGAG